MEGLNVRKAIALLVVLFFVPSAWAGPKSLYLTNIGHYIQHHRLEVLGDFMMVAASAADVETSIRSQRTPGVCESNLFLPCHPSRAQLWGVKLPFIVGLAAADHYILKWSDDPPSVRAFKAFVLPTIWGTANAVTAKDNARLIR
jgi:hypothetical protein